MKLINANGYIWQLTTAEYARLKTDLRGDPYGEVELSSYGILLGSSESLRSLRLEASLAD